ncbi:tail assembly-like protein [Caudovirales GX15bay]|nr:tail assembly-like protein [Caudovirales GX15bay]
MQAIVVERPSTFDRVDHVKEAVGEEVLLGDDQLWILGDQLVVDVDDGDDKVTVPKGFTTDGASIPKIAQWMTGWTPWDEPQRWAAITHDWLYTQRGVGKLYADRVFRSVLESEGAPAFKRNVMFIAVVIGGWPAYFTDQRTGPSVWV